MSSSFFISWFAVMFPLVISPGPANIIFAASGAKFGIRQSLPLMLGVDLVFILMSLSIGFGIGAVFRNNNEYMAYLQLFGSFYLLYLAYKFFLPIIRKETIVNKKFDFKDGVIIQILNVKGWLMLLLMFSLFTSKGIFEDANMNILLLVLMLFILNVLCHLFWISLSSYIVKTFCKKENLKIQNILFSLSLVFVAIYLLLDNKLLLDMLF